MHSTLFKLHSPWKNRVVNRIEAIPRAEDRADLGSISPRVRSGSISRATLRTEQRGVYSADHPRQSETVREAIGWDLGETRGSRMKAKSEREGGGAPWAASFAITDYRADLHRRLVGRLISVMESYRGVYHCSYDSPLATILDIEFTALSWPDCVSMVVCLRFAALRPCNLLIGTNTRSSSLADTCTILPFSTAAVECFCTDAIKLYSARACSARDPEGI